MTETQITQVRNNNDDDRFPQGLQPIHDLLTSHGWTRHYSETSILQHTDTSNTTQPHTTFTSTSTPTTTTTTEFTYTKDPTRDDEFRIRITKKDLTVAVPIANASFLFASKFTNYFLATEFVERHLATYEEKMEIEEKHKQMLENVD